MPLPIKSASQNKFRGKYSSSVRVHISLDGFTLINVPKNNVHRCQTIQFDEILILLSVDVEQ